MEKHESEIEMHENEGEMHENGEEFNDIQENNPNEVYTVNFSPFKNISYGGNEHTCTLFSIENETPIALIEGFSDSVVYSKQLEEDLLLVCTIDGTISLLSREDVLHSEKIDEDITFVTVEQDKILIGGSLGTLYVFSLDLSSHNVYLGHSSDIHKASYFNNTFYSLSDRHFIAFNEFSFQQKYKKNLKGATVFEGIPGTDIFCIGKEGEILILKNGFILHKFEIIGVPESVVFAFDHFIVGGSFPYLVLINTKLNWREYKLKLEIEGTTKIQAIGNYQLALSTMCGMVGRGDIRRDESFVFKSSGVGSVFDFQYVEGKFYAGGAYGFEVVEME